MNPQSAAIAGSANPLKSHLESEIRAKIFSKSADPFAYSRPPPPTPLYNWSNHAEQFLVIANEQFIRQTYFQSGYHCILYNRSKHTELLLVSANKQHAQQVF